MFGGLLMVSRDTMFEIDLLREFEGQMLHHQASFESFTDYYNELWQERLGKDLAGRQRLCRKRLTDAVHRWACLLQHLQAQPVLH